MRREPFRYGNIGHLKFKRRWRADYVIDHVCEGQINQIGRGQCTQAVVVVGGGGDDAKKLTQAKQQKKKQTHTESRHSQQQRTVILL